MSPEELSAIAGAVLALLFQYVPWLNTWYGGLSSLAKRLIMVGLLAVVSAGVFGAACIGLGDFLGIAVVCSGEGAWDLILVFIAAIVANQGTYLLAQPPKSVEAAKAARS